MEVLILEVIGIMWNIKAYICFVANDYGHKSKDFTLTTPNSWFGDKNGNNVDIEVYGEWSIVQQKKKNNIKLGCCFSSSLVIM